MQNAVIIGSGLGGLECGAILSREGFRVTVLEKNPRTGGCLQTFTRGGHTFDTGIHYIGGLGEGQVLNQYLKYLGVRDALDVELMATDGFDTVVSGGDDYRLAMGHGLFEEKLRAWFPCEAENAGRFCEMLRTIGATMSVEGLRRGSISEGAMPWMERSAYGTIDNLFAEPDLKRVLTATSMLCGGAPDKTPMYHYGMITHSYIESAWRFVGGSQQLADALTAQIRAAGGEVRTGAEVTAIRVTDNRVRGVEVNGGEARGGEFIEASHVISDIHPAVTLDLMERSPYIKKTYETRLRTLENSTGIFTIYLIMKHGAFPYINRNFYIREYGAGWNDRDGRTPRDEYDTRRDTPRAAMFSMQATGGKQISTDVASILCPVDTALFDRWSDTHSGRRGAEYLEFKARLAEKVVDFTARRFPGLRGAVDDVYTTSPLSWRDQTASPGGSAYGIVKDYRSPLTTLVPVNTPLENLLFTGQNVNVHGALGVTVSAALTCARLLGTEYLAKKIGYA
jgi:phytoene dehydrogenase-like protein